MSVFISRAYDKLRSLIFPFDLIVDEIPDKGKVLDIGCGHGTLPIYIARKKRNVHVLGVELNRNRVLIAREKVRFLNNVEFTDSDITKFKAEGGYDVITCLDVLHHIPRDLQEGVVKKVSGMLKPGGVFILVEIDRNPLPKYIWNYMHDMIFTRSRELNYIKKEDALSMLKSSGLYVSATKDASSLMYARYMITAERRKG